MPTLEHRMLNSFCTCFVGASNVDQAAWRTQTAEIRQMLTGQIVIFIALHCIAMHYSPLPPKSLQLWPK